MAKNDTAPFDPKWGVCKATRKHSWFVTEVKRNNQWGTPIAHMCEICGTVRNRIIDRLGAVSYQSYDHPRGYANGEITAADYRISEIRSFRAAQRATDRSTR